MLEFGVLSLNFGVRDSIESNTRLQKGKNGLRGLGDFELSGIDLWKGENGRPEVIINYLKQGVSI